MMLNFYTDRFVPEGAGGCARGPLIFIREKYRNDRGILEHERAHRKQWFVQTVVWAALLAAAAWCFAIPYEIAIVSIGAHGGLYLVVRRYRLWAEVAAYREQMKWGNLAPESAARRLAKPCYRLGITAEQAMKYFE